MTTPICDFVRDYIGADPVRMHMPGHKGTSLLGCEAPDLTEIDGADDLFHPTGIIAESEANASKLFGCKTLYSTEGSSLCIRAMLYLAVQHALARGKKPVIAAARNVHKTFLTAAALLDLEIVWLPPAEGDSYLHTAVTAAQLNAVADRHPTALYLTSPDYLGYLADIPAAADFCRRQDMLLLTDSAHGAYLRFLPQPLHPTALGADLCCDSAHKTLPALTGAAYLHFSDRVPEQIAAQGKAAMSLFASTSPSYLILQSLDRCNAVLAGEFPEMLRRTVQTAEQCKTALTAHGFTLCGDEPMKITLLPKTFGYTGHDLAEQLRKQHIFCEFADPDHLVLMPSPYQAPDALLRVTECLCAIPRAVSVTEQPPALRLPQTVCTPREAIMARQTRLPLSDCVGRICAELSVSCPPAVPVAVCGERITEETAAAMRYYGMTDCAVLA